MTASAEIREIIERNPYISTRNRYIRDKEHDSFVIDTKLKRWYWNSIGVSGNLEDTLNASKKTRRRWEALREKQERLDREAEQKARELIKSLPSKAAYYHSKVDQGRDYWHSQGLTDETIDRFQLGYSGRSEAIRGYATYTIPYRDNGEIVSLRHRLKGKSKDKYRPQFAGLGNRVFNGDRLNRTDSSMPDNQVVIVEGEVKAIVLDQHGFRVLAIPGANPGQDCLNELVEKLAGFDTVIIALDQGQEQNARKTIAPLFNGKRVIVADLTGKPDDLIVKDGWSPARLYEFMLEGDDVIPPKAKEKLDRKARIVAEAEALLLPVFSNASEADILNAHWLGFPRIETKDDYQDIIDTRKYQTVAKEWQEYVEAYHPELDAQVEYDRKRTENDIERMANCGRVIFSKMVMGKIIERHAPCGLCDRCKEMDRRNLRDAIIERGADLTILTTDDDKEKAKIVRQCSRAKVLYKIYPITTDDQVEYEIIINKYMPEMGEVLEPLLLTDDRLNRWLTGAKDRNSSGKLLPTKDDLRKRWTEKLPHEADDSAADDDCVDIITRNIIPKDKKAKMYTPSIVDIKVVSLETLQAALDLQHTQDMKRLVNQGKVIFGVSLKKGRYTKSDLPSIIREFNDYQDELRELKRQNE